MEEIIQKIKHALANPNGGLNSMGCSENNYDPYYMVGACFTEEELGKMNEESLQNLIKLASYASEAFY